MTESPKARGKFFGTGPVSASSQLVPETPCSNPRERCCVKVNLVLPSTMCWHRENPRRLSESCNRTLVKKSVMLLPPRAITPEGSPVHCIPCPLQGLNMPLPHLETALPGLDNSKLTGKYPNYERI